MITAFIILLALATLAYISAQPNKVRLSQAYRGNAWQKIAGALAVIIAILILINPELLGLGLLGDAAFFDVLVFLISLQLQTLAAQVWRRISEVFCRTLRRMKIPSPGLSYVLAAATVLIATVISSLQKVAQRLSS